MLDVKTEVKSDIGPSTSAFSVFYIFKETQEFLKLLGVDDIGDCERVIIDFDYSKQGPVHIYLQRIGVNEEVVKRRLFISDTNDSNDNHEIDIFQRRQFLTQDDCLWVDKIQKQNIESGKTKEPYIHVLNHNLMLENALLDIMNVVSNENRDSEFDVDVIEIAEKAIKENREFPAVKPLAVVAPASGLAANTALEDSRDD